MAADQFWGIRQRHYSASANAALFYEAEGRTLQGGATVVTGTVPASGGASNNVVRAGHLTPGWQSMLSTQATGGGAHLEHIGIYDSMCSLRADRSSMRRRAPGRAAELAASGRRSRAQPYRVQQAEPDGFSNLSRR